MGTCRGIYQTDVILGGAGDDKISGGDGDNIVVDLYGDKSIHAGKGINVITARPVCVGVRIGYPTGLTASSNDFGVDGYVFHPDGMIVIQCKRYGVDNAVGRPAIQQFKGVIEEQRAYRGYFVTTSRFTDEATESASKSDRIVLIDGDELLRWHKAGSKGK